MPSNTNKYNSFPRGENEKCGFIDPESAQPLASKNDNDIIDHYCNTSSTAPDCDCCNNNKDLLHDYEKINKESAHPSSSSRTRYSTRFHFRDDLCAVILALAFSLGGLAYIWCFYFQTHYALSRMNENEIQSSSVNTRGISSSMGKSLMEIGDYSEDDDVEDNGDLAERYNDVGGKNEKTGGNFKSANDKSDKSDSKVNSETRHVVVVDYDAALPEFTDNPSLADNSLTDSKSTAESQTESDVSPGTGSTASSPYLSNLTPSGLSGRAAENLEAGKKRLQMFVATERIDAKTRTTEEESYSKMWGKQYHPDAKCSCGSWGVWQDYHGEESRVVGEFFFEILFDSLFGGGLFFLLFAAYYEKYYDKNFNMSRNPLPHSQHPSQPSPTNKNALTQPSQTKSSSICTKKTILLCVVVVKLLNLFTESPMIFLINSISNIL